MPLSDHNYCRDEIVMPRRSRRGKLVMPIGLATLFGN